ncbi:hypothetical protein WJX82_007772 [Trebouxia sp. C0006]
MLEQVWRVPELNDLCSAMLWQIPLLMPRPTAPEVDQKLQISGIFAMWQCFKQGQHAHAGLLLCCPMTKMIASMPRPADCEEDTKLQLSGIFALWQCFKALVDNIQRMYAAPCWAPHFFKLAKDNDGWCTPAHPAPDMATIVAALHDAQFLSESALDFIKTLFPPPRGGAVSC